MKKKFTSMMLVFAMIVTLFQFGAVSAFAANESQIYLWNKMVVDLLPTDIESIHKYLSTENTKDPQLVELTDEITDNIVNDYDKVKAIHDWVAANIWYSTYEPTDPTGMDDIYSALYPFTNEDVLTIINGEHRTRCGGYTAIFKSLLDTMEIPNVYCHGSAGEIGNIPSVPTHAWNMVYVDNRWIIVDATWGSRNSYDNGIYSPQQPIHHDYFDISLEKFSQDHQYTGMFPLNPKSRYSYLPLVKVSIPDGIEKIPQNAFSHSNLLASVVIPDSVKEIGEGAFYSCQNLTIYGSAGSVAEKYAKEIHKQFKITEAPQEAINLSSASSWAQADINEASKKGFLETSLQNNYTTPITRQDFCRIALHYMSYRDGKLFNGLYMTDKGYKMASSSSDVKFSDTETIDGASFIPEYAYFFGITNGVKAPTATEPGIFDQLGTMTREQAATMIMNTCKAMGMNTNVSNTTTFADQSEISPWATQGINFVVANGFMSGVGDNKFNPKGTYTRQEAIVTFNRIK
jgi:hypothetical protein